MKILENAKERSIFSVRCLKINPYPGKQGRGTLKVPRSNWQEEQSQGGLLTRMIIKETQGTGEPIQKKQSSRGQQGPTPLCDQSPRSTPDPLSIAHSILTPSHRWGTKHWDGQRLAQSYTLLWTLWLQRFRVNRANELNHQNRKTGILWSWKNAMWVWRENKQRWGQGASGMKTSPRINSGTQPVCQWCHF